MKNHSASRLTYQPTEAAIREKAHELYMRSGWVHGRDLDNWLEAEADLLANPPAESAGRRTPARRHGPTQLPPPTDQDSS